MVSVSFLPVLPRGARAAALAAASVTLAALTAVPAATASAAPTPVRPEDRAGDHLTLVVRHAGPARDGRYELFCHPGAGRHPDVAGACRVLDANTQWGRDTFAPVDPDSVCTLIYGGPATARVTGTWAGRPVDARYDRGNGCEIARWDRMVPFLPRVGSSSGTTSRTTPWQPPRQPASRRPRTIS